MIKLVPIDDNHFYLEAQTSTDRKYLETIYNTCGGPEGVIRIVRSSEGGFKESEAPEIKKIVFSTI